jgi:hypothetical protein
VQIDVNGRIPAGGNQWLKYEFHYKMQDERMETILLSVNMDMVSDECELGSNKPKCENNINPGMDRQRTGMEYIRIQRVEHSCAVAFGVGAGRVLLRTVRATHSVVDTLSPHNWWVHIHIQPRTNLRPAQR